MQKRKSYYVKKRLLSVRDAVLLHLLEHYGAEWPGSMPFSVSQEGVAQGVGGHRGHVSRILRELIRGGLVYQDVGRVDGVSTRVKAYHLTEEGAREAVRIADDVRSTLIDVVGEAEPVALSAIEKRYGGRSRLLDVALHTKTRSFDPAEFEEWLMGRERFVDFTKRIPVLRQFHGRKDELRKLMDWSDSHEAKVVAIRGMAGIGKTSLAARFIELERGSTNTFWYTVEEWSSLSDLLKALVGFTSAMGTYRLSAHVGSNRNPDIEEILLLLERELMGRKALMVFDDVHKAGGQLLHFLRGYVRSIQRTEGPKVILVGRTMPRLYDRRDVKVGGQVVETELGGLNEADSAEFLKSKGVPDASVPGIVETTKGHPLFLELFEEGANLARGSFRRFLREEVYGGLSEGEAAALGVASILRTPVFGHAFGVDERASLSDAMTLVSRGLLTETADGRFELHDLLREHLAEEVPTSAKAKFHASAAEYYRILGDEVSTLEAVYHLLKAGDGDSAIELAVARGREVLDKGVSDELLSLLDELLGLEPGGEDLAELLLVKGEAEFHRGNWDEALDAYSRALEVSEGIANEYKAAEALRQMGQIRLERSDHEAATDLLMASLQVSRRVKDLLGLANTYYELGKLHVRTGPYSKAKRLLDLSLKWAERSKDRTATGKALFALGSLERTGGKDLERAIGLERQAMELFEEDGKVFHIARAYHGIGMCLKDLGRSEDAVSHLRRSLELLKKCGNARGQACVLRTLAGILIGQERNQEAEPLLEESLETFRRLGNRREVAYIHLHYAGLYASPDQYGLTSKHLERAVKEFESLGEWEGLTQALTYKGQLLEHLGMLDEARAAFEEALASTDRIKDPRVRARIMRLARAASQGKETVDVAALSVR